jgi:hypothetical protein
MAHHFIGLKLIQSVSAHISVVIHADYTSSSLSIPEILGRLQVRFFVLIYLPAFLGVAFDFFLSFGLAFSSSTGSRFILIN